MKKLSIILALFLAFSVSGAQTFTIDQPLNSSGNLPYFQLLNSVGDSTYTIGISVGYDILFQGQRIALRPDSIHLLYYATADSIYSVQVRVKTKASRVAAYNTTLLDSVASTTAAVSQGSITIPALYYAKAVDGGFGLAFLANTARNAISPIAHASKIYFTLKYFYTLP